MDVQRLAHGRSNTDGIETIEMHTCGEPTRIVFSGYPNVRGTLLEQREAAKQHHDHIRRLLICEPRGHREMYGAVLRPQTEHVDAGRADIGVLFLTNDGYSTMCGHATLALGRFLVDSAGNPETSSILGLDRFRARLHSQRDTSPDHLDGKTATATLRLHAPCGIVFVSVPLSSEPPVGVDWSYDTSKPISYESTPSYVCDIDMVLPIPQTLRWPELGEAEEVRFDVAYGGAYYIIAPPIALGFAMNSLVHPDIPALTFATKQLKAAFNASKQHLKAIQSPMHDALSFLYGTIVVDKSLGAPAEGTSGAETGICFFADQQVDRSPTGSGVQARVVLAHAKGELTPGQKWTYHSLVSGAHRGQGAFIGGLGSTAVDGDRPAFTVIVSGSAKYTGSCSFIVEDDDAIGKGFWFGES